MVGKNSICALFISILIHGLVAAALVAYLDYAPHPDVLATLDLSSVELSFAETVEETAAVVPMPASEGRQVPLPPQEEKPPEVKPEALVRREPGEIRFPEPREDVRLKTQDARRETKDLRRETEDAKRETEDERRAAEDARAASVPTAAPRQARVDAPPRPRRNIKPDYPKGARQRGEQGEVVLEIRISAKGTVDGVKVAESSGFPELDEAALRATRAAKFTPARAGRDAVASTARLKLQFKLK